MGTLSIRRFDDAAAFEQATRGFLVAREAENNLLLGLTVDVRSGAYPEHPPLLATFEDAGTIAACVLQTPPHRPVISATSVDPHAVADRFVELFPEHVQVVPGVLGPAKVADRIAVRWGERYGSRPTLASSQRIYQLDAVRPVAGVRGTMRRAGASDRDRVIRWMKAFAVDTGDRGAGPPVVDRWLSSETDRALYFWEVADEAVSMAGYSGPTPNGVRIGYVYTPPEQRRRGYASALVAALSQQQLDAGRRFCFLFTDLANPTSNHIYQEIGYRPVADVHAWDF